MKKYSTLVLILAITGLHTVLAQNIYHVLNTKGIIKIKKTGNTLKTNDQISDKDVLIFSKATDAVAVISTKNGRMILRPKQNPKSSELICVVSEILNPGTGRLSARNGSITNAIEIQKYFSDDSLNILGTTKVWISPMAYPMNAENFFFVRYTWQGQSINKKLSFNKDSLILNASELYKVDGKNISVVEISDAKLYYKKGSSNLMVCTFTISFPDETKVNETISAFRKYSSLKGEDFLKELYPLLKDTYGNTDKSNVREWVTKNIGSY
jgi:hypothetical protein